MNVNRFQSCLLLSASATLAGCSHQAPPAPAAAAAAPTISVTAAAPGDTPAARAAAQRWEQYAVEASRDLRHAQSRAAYDAAISRAHNNYRITLQRCGQLTGDDQRDCDGDAASDLEAGRAQAFARHRQ